MSFLQSLDHATAIARPAITVVLLVTGTFVGSEVMGQTALHLAGHTAGNMAAEAAIAGGITVSGDAVMTATGEDVRQTRGRLVPPLAKQLRRIAAAWLAGWLDRELLGGLLADLRRGADAQRSPAFAPPSPRYHHCATSVNEAFAMKLTTGTQVGPIRRKAPPPRHRHRGFAGS